LIYGEENTPIGYWPNSIFTYLKDKGNYAYWGGHVSGPTASTDSPQIGSGHFALEGYRKAAFIKNIKIVDGNNNLVNPRAGKALAGTTSASKFTVSDYEIDKDGMHTYYGGPGDLA
jgi:prepilin-type processing-associated H-X9-DG protein